MPQKLEFQPYSASWNTRSSVTNYNIKESMFDVAKLLYLLHDNNWRNNWPEMVFLLFLGPLVEFPLHHQHTNPSYPELYFEYIDHWWKFYNRDRRLDHSHFVFTDTWRYVKLSIDVRLWVNQGVWKNLRPQMQWQYVQARLSILALQLGSGRTTPDLHYITWMCQVMAYNIFIKRDYLANSWCQK